MGVSAADAAIDGVDVDGIVRDHEMKATGPDEVDLRRFAPLDGWSVGPQAAVVEGVDRPEEQPASLAELLRLFAPRSAGKM